MRARLLAFVLSSCAPSVGSAPEPIRDEPDRSDTGRISGDDEIEHVETPEPLALEADADRGFRTAPFDLTLTANASGATVTWTLDGSDPRESPTGGMGPSPITLRIDPSLGDGRDATPAVVVRAVATEASGSETAVLTHTFIFPDQVAALSPHDVRPGDGWPPPYETNDRFDDRHAMDYGLDPRVTDDPAYAALLDDALFAIPSISISTDLGNLFDDTTGIYLHAMEHGAAWERPASLEIIDPEDAHEVQVDMGLRIRGGWSRHPSNPKHAFRLFFRGDYGDTKLRFALFEDEGADTFDKVDLRTAQNYSWSFKGGAGRENTFLRDVLSRDLQLSLGRPGTRSRFYHLYLNGVYWGLYQTQERAEARFAASYFGGEPEDYDVVKVNGDIPTERVIEATDGDLTLWEEVWERCEAGLGEDAAYLALQGLDDTGARDPDQRVLVDIDNLIDYMLVIFYAGNFDSPTGAFTNNQGANNFFAIIDRTDPDIGFRFFIHDAEHSALADPFGPGIGLEEDRVNLGSRSDDYRMNVARFADFHPQWLHHRLTANAAYRARFAARARALLADDGSFSEEPVRALVEARAAQIELAIIAESARWGDTKDFSDGGRTWRTRDDDWRPAVSRLVNGWVPHRRPIVIRQLQAAGLW